MKRIAVLQGGYSKERIISLKSAPTIFQNIDRSLYFPIMVTIDQNEWTAEENGTQYTIDKSDFSYRANDQHFQFDCAVIVIHGSPGEDGKLQGYFDMIGIPYSTCSQFNATLTFNKFMCNRVLGSHGFAVAKGLLIDVEDSVPSDLESTLGYPVFVKPAQGGSSFGTNRVNEQSELESALHKAREHGGAALIEEFLDGEEFTNGVYRSQNGVMVLPITQIKTSNEFFDFDAKYKGESDEITPAPISQDLENKIKSITKQVYELLGLDGICRVDYIVREGVPFLVEINTVPGQSAESIIPKMLKCQGLELKEVLTEVIELASFN